MMKRYIKTLDFQLFITIVMLCAIGVIMVYSSSSVIADMRYEQSEDSFFISQLLAIGLGAVLFFVFSLLPYQMLKKRVFLGVNMLLSITLLGAVLIIGETTNSAQAWVSIGGFRFQPTEFIKIAIIVVLAARYTARQPIINRFWEGIFPPLLYVLFIFALVYKQNDLGTGLIIIGIVGCMVVGVGMAPRKLKKVLVLGSLAAAFLGVIAYNFILQTHQLARFTAAYDPFSVASSTGYQPINAYMAMTNGGFFGVGLGNSIQKYGRLPEAHTDYIMAIIAEELGFFGVSVILIGLAFIALRSLIIAKRCPDTFGSLLAIGISSYIFVQTFVNIGGITGIIPMTGVPLPFISFGGSSIAATLFGMGILMNIARYTRSTMAKKIAKEERPNLTVVK